jgi:hypothetical protein
LNPSNLLSKLTAWSLLNLYLFVGPSISHGQQEKFWQVFFKLEISGEYKSSASDYLQGFYCLDLEWLGFLEEDGLDFIIYHLGLYPSRWEITEKSATGVLTSSEDGKREVPVPGFRLEYVRGEEKEIYFYFSVDNLSIPLNKLPGLPETRLIFPSIPWTPVPPDESRVRKIISGQKLLVIPREKLKLHDFEQRFDWVEEMSLPDRKPASIHQRHRATVSIHLIRCDLTP